MSCTDVGGHAERQSRLRAAEALIPRLAGVGGRAAQRRPVVGRGSAGADDRRDDVIMCCF